MTFIAKAIATSAAVCATLFSFSWSEQGGASLSVETAQARVGRPLTPVSVAGVARRQNRRAGYGGYGYGPAGAAAAGTAAAVAGAGYYGGPGYYGGGPYYRPGAWGARAAYYGAAPAAPATSTAAPPWNLTTAYYAGGPWYGYGGWDDYRTRNSIVCTPGTLVKAADGLQYLCQ